MVVTLCINNLSEVTELTTFMWGICKITLPFLQSIVIRISISLRNNFWCIFHGSSSSLPEEINIQTHVSINGGITHCTYECNQHNHYVLHVL